jgi:23S rRNA pseudouridine2605 synthase
MGYCSRSEAFALIREGEVAVNGKVQRDGEFPVNLEADRFAVRGETITDADRVYLMVNKPRGIVTTAADEKGRDTVYDLLPTDIPWVAPVGRLDKASEGLLLMTNDSEWGDRIAAPESHIEKTYHVQIAAQIDEIHLEKLRAGVEDGDELLRARSVTVLRTGKKNCWLEIVLDEGRNRQIRRMLQVLRIEVLRLVRIAIGPLVLGELPKGEWRALADAEKQLLDRAVNQRSSR